MDYLTLCAIVKDQKYLPEWVEYHRLVGIERLYLYDNGTVPSSRSCLKKQAEEGFVNVIPFPGRCRQLEAYRHCLEYFGNQSRWSAFIDADEFLVPNVGDDLRRLIRNYEAFGGLGVNWLIFGSSFHLKSPPGLQIENYTLRSRKGWRPNVHIKSIVQNKYVVTTNSPHFFVYKSGYHCVNERCEPIFGPFSRNATKTIQLNHYFLRSFADFLHKIQQGRVDGSPDLTMNDFFEYDRNCNDVYDDHILRFAPRLKNNLSKLYHSST